MFKGICVNVYMYSMWVYVFGGCWSVMIELVVLAQFKILLLLLLLLLLLH